MNLEVGKKYKTRLGHKAFVFSVSGHPQEAIGVIELKSDGSHSPAMWFIDGSFDWDKKESGNDIVAEWDDTPDPGEGWRLLHPDEDVETGDEYYSHANKAWLQSGSPKTCNGKQGDFPYRRRIAPQYVPYTWEDREELRGRWYLKKENGMEIQVTQLQLRDDGIFSIDGWKADWFLSYCEWLDGTPCGKVVV
jgi:hypothetical protein